MKNMQLLILGILILHHFENIQQMVEYLKQYQEVLQQQQK